MTELQEGRFVYRFPVRWQAVKWDETGFHRKQFQSFGGASKAAEFVSFPEDSDELWLIECKDFRPSGRKKATDLCDEIAQKIKATLAGLVCARNAEDALIRRFSRMALKKTQIRCVVHWEHPLKPHRLWPKENMSRATMRAKLRQRLQATDPNTELGNQQQLNAILPWQILEAGE